MRNRQPYDPQFAQCDQISVRIDNPMCRIFRYRAHFPRYPRAQVRVVGLVAATLIERVKLPPCSQPDVLGGVHTERLDDFLGVSMGLLALQATSRSVAT
jgi:hypothetical protein